ncbi:MAG: C40 family peptidase [Verrucomicrobia bacterium]|nr:C40 family peptidase [Verrucomicrobiota bacterium]
MKPIFSTPERVEALQAAAAAWQGTPFAANSCSRGVGVSCQHLAAALLREGAGLHLDPPNVDMAHAEFSDESLVEPWMDGQTAFVSIPPGVVKPGDVLGFRLRRVVHHVGVCISPGAFVHSLDGIGTVVSSLADATWRGRLRRVWRPVE